MSFDVDTFCKKEGDDHKHIDIFFPELSERILDGWFIDIHKTAFYNKF